jgi:hypothetical protein
MNEYDDYLSQLSPDQRTRLVEIIQSYINPPQGTDAAETIDERLDYIRNFQGAPAPGETTEYQGRAMIQPTQMQPMQMPAAPRVQYGVGMQPQMPVQMRQMQAGINPQQAFQRLGGVQTNPYGQTFGPQAAGIGNLIQ